MGDGVFNTTVPSRVWEFRSLENVFVSSRLCDKSPLKACQIRQGGWKIVVEFATRQCHKLPVRECLRNAREYLEIDNCDIQLLHFYCISMCKWYCNANFKLTNN